MREDIAIAICGQAGQGIKTLESLLARIFSGNGYNVFTTREFMSRVRGGMNSTSIRVSSKRVRVSSAGWISWSPSTPAGWPTWVIG